MIKFVSVLILYLFMTMMMLVSSTPDPGYERLWFAAAFVASAIYCSPVVLFIIIVMIVERYLRKDRE